MRKSLPYLIICVLCLSSSLFADQSKNESVQPELKNNTQNAIVIVTEPSELTLPEPNTYHVMDSLEAMKLGIEMEEKRYVDITKFIPHPTPVPTPTVLGQAVNTTFILTIWAKILYDIFNTK